VSGILPAIENPWFRRVFARRSGSMLAKSFHAVRVAPGGERILGRARDSGEDLALCLSHASWWDPIVAAFLWSRSLDPRPVRAPMDRVELERFAILRRVGIFGVDPDDPATLPAMVDHLAAERAKLGPFVFIVTPQGSFADPRDPVRLRPGAAAAIARLGIRRVIAVAIEYAFWTDRKPEVFLRLVEVEPPVSPTRVRWHRAMEGAMQRNGEALAELVRGRDPRTFETLLGGDAARVHPVYDLWLRLTGRGNSIDATRRMPAAGGKETPP
jgi:1-acyl-sn-glycerol-3-phosphate acyltransferase